jgi:hypothetical protein
VEGPDSTDEECDRAEDEVQEELPDQLVDAKAAGYTGEQTVDLVRCRESVLRRRDGPTVTRRPWQKYAMH